MKSIKITPDRIKKYDLVILVTDHDIIDYEFDKNHKRRIKNISITPKQTTEINLDQGDRVITIANFNDLEMVNQSRYLHIL